MPGALLQACTSVQNISSRAGGIWVDASMFVHGVFSIGIVALVEQLNDRIFPIKHNILATNIEELDIVTQFLNGEYPISYLIAQLDVIGFIIQSVSGHIG